MRAISPVNRLRLRRAAGGYTLIEACAVIVVVAVLAASVIPNLVALKRTRDIRKVEASVQRLPLQARVEARLGRVPVVMRVEGDELVLERRPPAPRAGADGSAAAAEAEAEVFKRVPLGEDIRIDAIQQGVETVDVASWEWTVYPDGSCNAVNLEFVEGDARKSLVVPSEGDARWVTGEEIEPAEERWAAGEIEQRG